jgi:hypothetical protein
MAYIIFVNPAILEKAGMTMAPCSSPPASRRCWLRHRMLAAQDANAVQWTN